MSFSGGPPPSFVMPQMITPRPPQNIDPTRMNIMPALPHNMHYPPPIAPGQQLKFVPAPPIQAQQQFYPPDDRPGVFYQPIPPMYSFNHPPPTHHQPYAAPAPFLPQQSFEAVAEQMKSLSSAAGQHPSIPPQNVQQLGHPTLQMAPHQQMHIIPPSQMHMHHYPRQPYSQNSLSRGQTPTTTASHSGSKRSSPQNIHSADTNNPANQQQLEDYTPPGTPQELTPMTDDQKQQYILGQNGDKTVDALSNKFNEASLADRNPEQHDAADIFDTSKPMEFYNQSYQNHDSRNWQHNVRVGERNRHNPNHTNYDNYNGRGSQNDRRQPLSRHQPNNRPSQDSRLSNQQRFPPPQQQQQQRYPPPTQNQQNPRQMNEQWRSTPHEVEQRILECSYCRMLQKPVEQYSTHIVREQNGKSNCPEMQKVVCQVCNGTEHLDYFCPKNQKGSNDLQRTADALTPFLQQRKNPPPPFQQQHQPPQHRYYQQNVPNQHHGGHKRH